MFAETADSQSVRLDADADIDPASIAPHYVLCHEIHHEEGPPPTKRVRSGVLAVCPDRISLPAQICCRRRPFGFQATGSSSTNTQRYRVVEQGVSMRYCTPAATGRGAGLGNELFGWAKGFLASQELELRLLHPPFGTSRYGYRRDFGTSRFDWLGRRALHLALPTFRFSKEDYLATGEVDYARAIRVYADRHGLYDRSWYALQTEGMWGGFLAIRDARDWVRTMLSSQRNAQANLYRLAQQVPEDRVLVGLHVRTRGSPGDRGTDFMTPTTAADFQGMFNVALPIDWYVNIVDSISRELGDRVHFLLSSNGTAADVALLTARGNVTSTFGLPFNACSDLIALSRTDLVVCSISSYSMWAAFLSDAPYIWFRDQLTPRPGGSAIWPESSPTVNHAAAMDQNELRAAPSASALPCTPAPRGIAVGMEGHVPADVLAYLERKASDRRAPPDLLRFGTVPSDVVEY